MPVNTYAEFIARKEVKATARGLAEVPDLAPHLRRFQAANVAFGLTVGSWGDFMDTGLGKTADELEWAKHAAAATNERALILTPLAVARQIEAEGNRWGYEIRVIREQAEAGAGLNVCNYDRLDKLDPSAFGAVVLDESSIIKTFTGKTSRALIASFEGHRFRMAATATPAPNDHMELGQHCAFLGAMDRDEMLMRFFVHDSADTKSWRLKGHAVTAFWDWMATWSRMAEHPRDLGDDVPGFDLPELRVIRHHADSVEVAPDGTLFAGDHVSATTMFDIKRQTAEARADLIARLVIDDSDEPWVLWCDTNDEADAIARCLKGTGVEWDEVRGSHPIERKEEALEAFRKGSLRVILTKSSICGWGLCWQHCARMAFVGRSFSYESWYQAVRRCWRFGQTRPVECHLIVAAGEESIGRVIDRKAGDHARMKAEMVAAMRRAIGIQAPVARRSYNPTHQGRLPAWL